MAAQWRKLQVINFSKECCPNAMRHRQAVVLRRKRVGKFWTHATHAAGSGRARTGCFAVDSISTGPDTKTDLLAMITFGDCGVARHVSEVRWLPPHVVAQRTKRSPDYEPARTS